MSSTSIPLLRLFVSRSHPLGWESHGKAPFYVHSRFSAQEMWDIRGQRIELMMGRYQNARNQNAVDGRLQKR